LSLNAVRLLLGAAEAGFFPGIIFFLTLWFPAYYRGRIVGLFMSAIPISTVIGAPVSGLILNLEGTWGLHGWQWMFIIEALPALAMSVAVYFYLTDWPGEARWLTTEETQWLQNRLDGERANRERHGALSWFQSILDPRVILLGLVYMGGVIPNYGLSFFLPQIDKAFGGLSNVEVGLITALPYVVGAIGMFIWGWHSDATGERKWHTVIPLAIIVVSLMLAAIMPTPTLKMLCLCFAGFGIFALGPVFWTPANRLLKRHRRGGGYCRGQFNRQSGRLFWSESLWPSQRLYGRRCRQPDIPCVDGGDRCGHCTCAGT
jgi:MFS family permease